MIDERLREYLNWFKLSSNWRKRYIEKHQEYYKLYRSVIENKIYTHQTFVPLTFAMIEDFYAKLSLSLVSDDSKFYSIKLRGVNPPFKNSQQLIKDLEEILDFFVKHPDANFYLEIPMGIKHMLLYGISCNSCYPSFITDELNHIVFDHIPFFNIYPQPQLTSFKKLRWVIIRSMEHFENILEAQASGMYEGVDPDDYVMPESDEWNEFIKGLGFEPTEENIYDKQNRMVELLDVFFSNGHVITILGRKKIIRDTTGDGLPPLDGFPFIFYKSSGAPNEFMGISLVEAVKNLQKDINLIRSQRRENISLVLNKLFVASPFANIQFDTLYSAPGNVILADDPSGLRELPISDTATASAFREEQNINLDFQNVSGSTELVRGMAPRRKETATAIMTQQKMAQSRFEWNLRLIDLQLLKPLALKILIYARKWLKKEEYDAICGTTNAYEDFLRLSETNIKRFLSFTCSTEVITRSKEVERQQFMQVIPFLLKVPDINHLALIRRILMMFNFKNIDEIIPQLKERPETREFAEELEAGVRQSPRELLTKLLAGRRTP